MEFLEQAEEMQKRIGKIVVSDISVPNVKALSEASKTIGYLVRTGAQTSDGYQYGLSDSPTTRNATLLAALCAALGTAKRVKAKKKLVKGDEKVVGSATNIKISKNIERKKPHRRAVGLYSNLKLEDAVNWLDEVYYLCMDSQKFSSESLRHLNGYALMYTVGYELGLLILADSPSGRIWHDMEVAPTKEEAAQLFKAYKKRLDTYYQRGIVKAKKRIEDARNRKAKLAIVGKATAEGIAIQEKAVVSITKEGRKPSTKIDLPETVAIPDRPDPIHVRAPFMPTDYSDVGAGDKMSLILKKLDIILYEINC
jgi:ribonuclease HI